jgi:hypothetical protein
LSEWWRLGRIPARDGRRLSWIGGSFPVAGGAVLCLELYLVFTKGKACVGP